MNDKSCTPTILSELFHFFLSSSSASRAMESKTILFLPHLLAMKARKTKTRKNFLLNVLSQNELSSPPSLKLISCNANPEFPLVNSCVTWSGFSSCRIQLIAFRGTKNSENSFGKSHKNGTFSFDAFRSPFASSPHFSYVSSKTSYNHFTKI